MDYTFSRLIFIAESPWKFKCREPLMKRRHISLRRMHKLIYIRTLFDISLELSLEEMNEIPLAISSDTNVTSDGRQKSKITVRSMNASRFTEFLNNMAGRQQLAEKLKSKCIRKFLFYRWKSGS